MYAGPNIDFEIIYNLNNVRPVYFNFPVVEPFNVRVINSGGQAQIIWDASQNPDVTGYRLYGKREDLPDYVLLTQTTNTSFVTPHPVKISSTDTLWSYALVSINAAGEERYFTGELTNKAALTAYIAANPVSGLSPLGVSFTDVSEGVPTSWQWNFDGDGIIDSTAQNPNHVYTTPGSYDVTLTVADSNGSSTATLSYYITVHIDTDGDGLFDEYEVLLGTDPNLIDSDGDGLADGAGVLVQLSAYPFGYDLDLDGFVDGEQDYGTNPYLTDTDGDGVDDDLEILDGTDPLDIASFSAQHDGDINDDGNVDVTDLLLATRILLGTYSSSPVEQARWDVAPLVGGVPQPDSQNNAGDYAVLMRKIMGLVEF